MEIPNLKNILIIQTGFIGDVILTTPVISVLKEQYPSANISLVTTPIAAELFKNDPRLSQVIPFHKRDIHSGINGFFSFLKIIRACNFDAVFSLHKSLRTSLLVYLSQIPCRFGFKEAKLSWLYSRAVSRKHYEHDVLRNLAICENIGLDAKQYERPMSLALSDEALAKVDGILEPVKNKKIIGVAPGSVWRTKRWTEEGFAQLVNELILNEYAVVLIGGKGDLEPINKILTLLDPKTKNSSLLINTAGTLNLLESAALVSKCTAMISNDSAPLHMASSFQIPVVALFCATVPEFGFGPWKTKFEIVQVNDLSCRPCGRHGSHECPTGTHYCRNKISHNDVFAALIRLVGA